MTTRTILDAQIEAAKASYVYLADDDEGRIVEVALENLDTPVTSRAVLTFQLRYPFEKPFDGAVHGDRDGGVTLRQIIDAIRAGFQSMYRDTSVEPMEKLYNVNVRGPHGRAHHAIEHLAIGPIELDDETGHLEIVVSS
jgi:hypothetical protein